jgi:DNA invertase Pin-like site-specific DNA recombinase
MSTDLQLKGDSRRRQLEASRQYADTHGLELAEADQLEDIGISAFKGANAREGALGQFLTAIKSGMVESGSYLIVESLDRLSREKLGTAQALFLSIIESGINLVTLMDGRLYRANETNLVDLIMSLVIMSRAHEESQIKSLRLSAAWKNKKGRAADGLPMTKMCPAWLRLSPDRKAYEVIPERAAIVRKIFEDTAAGLGMYSIAGRLNEASIPAFVGRNGWHQSYIAKILGNRSVFGEFQPCTKVDGKRLPDGQPILNYFPTIVSEDLFYRANLSKSERRVSGKGRKGTGYTNLFTGVANCAYCDSRIVFENKGNGPKGGSYLVCDSAKRNLGCKATRWRYQDFETSFLAFVEELDIESILKADSNAEKRKALSDRLASAEGELGSVSGLMEKTYNVLAGGGPVDFVTAKLNELEQRKIQLTASIESLIDEQEVFLSAETRMTQSRDEIRDLVKRLQSSASDDLYKIRAQIASRIKAIVHVLQIAPQGFRPITLRIIDKLKTETPGVTHDVIDHITRVAEHPRERRRYFAIGFERNTQRIIYPSDEDPLRYEQQIVASKSVFETLEDPQ